MEVDILDFVEQCRHLAKQALGKYAGEPASGGFARWIHVVLHCFRLEEEHSFRETPNRLKYMAEPHDILDRDQDDLVDFTTIYSERLGLRLLGEVFRFFLNPFPDSLNALQN